jgi:hypothetical protein
VKEGGECAGNLDVSFAGKLDVIRAWGFFGFLIFLIFLFLFSFFFFLFSLF